MGGPERLLRAVSLLLVVFANSISPDYRDVSQQAAEAAAGNYNDAGKNYRTFCITY